jgi:sugar phosphate isomerase/epimerase
MWIDVADTVGKLSPDNEQVFQIMNDSGIQTQLWIGISEAYFGGLSDDSCMVKAEEMIRYLSKCAAPSGGKIGLYNHGGWFGDPVNEVRLIKAIPDQNLGIIFNFHHAHELLEAYPELVDTMMPYLWAVNLDGMRVEGPKILPIGAGDKEREMIQILKEKGFKGPYGILGHTEDADVKVILQGNLDGLKKILSE